MKYLDDFLIVEEGGIILFSHSTNSGNIKNDALFAGLLEAITIFFRESIGDEVVDINGKRTRISFNSRNQLLFIGIAPINKPKASITKELNLLANKFKIMFKEELNNIQDKDLMIYEKFRKEL
ncbi:MAG: hypothetical protein HWN80_02890 [Candidatus Lokiarchaeota archaeon]|nr:hypothetical protein [Candidatus Lokiarchaeota archaeon]